MTKNAKVSVNRGRPPDPAKREAIITAAGELFLESELGDISMDDVAKKAKVSKITVYKHFSDKRELFQTMIEKKMEANLSESLFSQLQGQDAFEDLVIIARGFTNIIYSKDGVNMYRTVVAESKRGADIPHMFYAKAVEPSNRLLEKHLAKLEGTGEFSFPDKRLAATIFFSIFKGDRFMRATMTIPMQEEQSETERFIRHIVGLYLKMFKLPEQQVIVDSKLQHYIDQLCKLTKGLDKLEDIIALATNHATNPELLVILKQTASSLPGLHNELAKLATQHQADSCQSASPTLIAMLNETENDITLQYPLDSLRDEVIGSHCVRVLQFIATCCQQLITAAVSLELDIRTLEERHAELTSLVQRFSEYK